MDTLIDPETPSDGFDDEKTAHFFLGLMLGLFVGLMWMLV